MYRCCCRCTAVPQLYYNGKAIVRLDRAHVHMWGVHAFLGPDDDT